MTGATPLSSNGRKLGSTVHMVAIVAFQQEHLDSLILFDRGSGGELHVEGFCDCLRTGDGFSSKSD